jgi:glycosyltransferase involved in cell wall biosynthesis
MIERGTPARSARGGSREPGTNGLRILLISKFFWPEEGGQSTILRRLLETWSSMGHEVTVLTTRSTPELAVSERIGGGTVLRLPVSFGRVFGTLGLVLRVHGWVKRRTDRFDVVCVSMLKHCALAALQATRGTGVPVVIKTEGSGPTGDIGWQEQAAGGRYIRRRCWEADAVIAISGEIESELLAAGADPGRVRLVPNGVPVPDEPWSRSQAPRYRRRLDLAEMPTICYTGRFLKLKGLSDLVRAHQLAERDVGPIQLLLIGQGPEREPLTHLAGSLGTADRVRFSGQVLDVEPYLRASDVYALPSYVEGMSMSLLEALALGLPAVATDIDANRNLLPAEHLPLVPPRDPQALAAAIELALDSGPFRQEASRKLVRERFGIESVAARYVDLFRELIRRERAGAPVQAASA